LFTVKEEDFRMAIKLKGKNQLKKFRGVAKRLVPKIASCEGVAGIILIGGLVRGFTDKFSDLDITVFLSRKDARLRRKIVNLGSDEAKRSGIDIDLEIHSLEDFKRRKWNETSRWDFSQAEIAFDPKGEVKGVFEERLKVPKYFWVKRVVVCAEYLEWYCCPPREDVGTVAEAWIDRGDLVSAHYCLTYSIDLMLKIIFALNKAVLPPQKWRFFYSQTLKWLPLDYVRLLREAMIIKELSTRDFKRRLKALRKMWHHIVPKIKEETGLTADQISKYYVEKILHQT
jgi:predicted nucleotidyltransferase